MLSGELPKVGSDDGGVDEEGIEFDDADAVEEASDVGFWVALHVLVVRSLELSFCAGMLGLGLVEMAGVPTLL